MPISEARRAATKKYHQEKCDRLTLDIPKGKREVYKQLADEMGISMSKLIQYGVDEFAQKHTDKSIFHPQGNKLTVDQQQLLNAASVLTPKARKQLIKFLETLAG